MIAAQLITAFVLMAAHESAPCDVLLWQMTGKGEDSMIYTLNFKEIGRGNAALRQCLDALEQSSASHLVVLYGAFGAIPPTADKQLIDRFDNLRIARGATCLYDMRDRRPVIATIATVNDGISVAVNGELHQGPLQELENLPAIKKAAAIVIVVNADLASVNAATGEKVRVACMWLSNNFTSVIVRLDVPPRRQ